MNRAEKKVAILKEVWRVRKESGKGPTFAQLASTCQCSLNHARALCQELKGEGLLSWSHDPDTLYTRRGSMRVTSAGQRALAKP